MSDRAGTLALAGGARRRPRWRRLAEAWAARCGAGEVTVTFPDGETRVYRGAAPGPSAAMRLNNGRIVWRMLTRGDIGLAESYVDGDWDTPDLAAVIAFGLANEAALGASLRGSLLARLAGALRFRLQANSRAGSRRNIAHHYDLGNDFYAAWLDPTMTYSAAIFPSPAASLEAAQREKFRRIIAALGVKEGDSILEIGCGWGGFAAYAAREAGARVTAITISQAQADYARRRVVEAGLADRVEIRITDYRDVRGTFDHIASIEMIEAVGEKNWPAYFGVLRDRLKPGGRAVIQAITVPDERFPAYRRRVDFIQRYIFPGGMLLSPGAIARASEAAGLRLVGATCFGADYAETLRRWNVRFQASFDAVRRHGFDDRFRRLWTYYLASCEACFDAGATDVGHFVLGRDQVPA